MGRNQQSYDILLDGNKYRILRQGGAGYSRVIQAAQVEEQELFSDQTRGIMQSRRDLRHFYQSNWAGGYEWWRPVQPNASADTYFNASAWDFWTHPGRARPLNEIDTTATGWNLVNADSPIVYWDQESNDPVPVAVGAAGSGNFDLVEWDSFNERWLDQGRNLVPTTHTPWDLIPFDGYLYGLSSTLPSTSGTVSTGQVHRTDNSTDQNGWITGITLGAGARLMKFNGSLWLYNGDVIYEMDLATPAVGTVQVDDGDGFDYLSNIDRSAAASRFHGMQRTKLAVATPEGIYYVKNVLEQYGPVARIWRMDRTDSGIYLKRPVGQLPNGMVCVSVIWANDSLLMLTTQDHGLVIDGGGTGGPSPRYELWHETQGTIGRIGRFDERAQDNDPVNENYPRVFAGAQGAKVWMGGGGGSLFMYDTEFGGIHKVFDSPNNDNEGYHTLAYDLEGRILLNGEFNPGAIEPSYRNDFPPADIFIESNPFNFGIPQETKWLTEFTLDVEGAGHSGDTFTVSVSTDYGASYTVVATIAGNVTFPYTEDITADAISGDVFMYKLEKSYGGSPARQEIMGIEWRAISGEMVEAWQFVFDATAIHNLENEVQRPEDVIDNLRATIVKNGFVSMTDDYNQNDSNAAVNVRVLSAALDRESLDEGAMTVQVYRVLEAT